MLRVPLHQLDAALPVPGYAREGDAGADLIARVDTVLACRGGRAVVPTGVAVAIPAGYAGPGASPQWAGGAARSDLSQRAGLVDAGFRGELRVVLVNHDPQRDYTVSRGDRIAQLVLIRVEEADFELVAEDGLGGSERGSGGFGHTGT